MKKIIKNNIKQDELKLIIKGEDDSKGFAGNQLAEHL